MRHDSESRLPPPRWRPGGGLHVLLSYPKAIVVGAALHLGKLAALTLAGVILQVPFALLFLELGYSATTHLLSGALGGFLGALSLRELRKIPALDAQARGK